MRRRRVSVRLVLVGALIAGGLGLAAPPAPVVADTGEGRPDLVAFGRISAGYDHSCAILVTGPLKCWGNGALGRLGSGDTTIRGNDPGEMADTLPVVDLGTGRTARRVSAGGAHTCAVLDNDSVKCFGAGGSGQLGLGDVITRGDGPLEMGDNLPAVDLGTGRTATEVVAGWGHNCAILDNGQLKCWGNNVQGVLGLGNQVTRGDGPGEMGDNLPAVDLGAGRTAVAVAAGDKHTCAILDNGQVKCWGDNQQGQIGSGFGGALGDQAGEMGDNLAPVPLGTGRTAVAITAGEYHTCALLDNGSVKCWGTGLNGETGYGDQEERGREPNQMGDNLPSVDLGTGRTAVGLSTMYHSTCAVLDDGSVKCWGQNNFGQLGLGDLATRGDEPGEMGDALPAVSLGTGRSVVAVSTGLVHSCALLDDGSLKCWGYNAEGRLGLGDSAHRGDGSGEMGDNLPVTQLVTPAPALTAALSADETSVAVGVPINYQVTVTNTGNVGLTDFVVSSTTAPDCEDVVPTLLPGEDHVIDCVYTPTVDDLGTRNATVTVDSAQTSAVVSNTLGVTVTPPAGYGVVRGTLRVTVFPNAAAPNALVAALDSTTHQVVGMDVSAGNGTFAMLVPAGSVRVFVADVGGQYVAAFHSATPTAVADGASVTVDPFVQRATGGVESRAVDEIDTDTGLPNALALTTNVQTGQIDGGALSSEFGYWVIRNLRSVPHLVTVLDLSGAHAPEYYDGAPSPATATPVNLVGGALQVIQPATMTRQTAPGGAATVQGTVTGAGGAPVSGVAAVVLNASTYSFEAGDVTDGSGNYSVPVDPGTYLVGFADAHDSSTLQFEWYDDEGANGLASATPVAAGAGSPATVDAALTPLRGTVAGTVTEDGSGDPLGGVWVVVIDPTGGVVGAVTTAPDGSYTVPGVAAGGMRVRFVDLDGTHVTEYHQDSADPNAGVAYDQATVVNVTGGATSTVDAGLALSS